MNVRLTYFREAMHDDRANRIKLKSMFFWDLTQRLVVMPYRVFGTNYRSHLQAPRIQEFWIHCPRIWDHYTLCNTPEESRPYLQGEHKVFP